MSTDVVLGAASGIGSAVARCLASSSERLLLADLRVDALKRLAEELDGDVEVHRCDLTERDDLEVLASAIGELGRFVLTAGIWPTMGQVAAASSWSTSSPRRGSCGRLNSVPPSVRLPRQG